jgi:hypothetical protein
MNDHEQMSWFARRLTPLLRMDRLGERTSTSLIFVTRYLTSPAAFTVTPLFMADLERNMIKWGNSGKFDPFEDIYSMVFQLTIRAAGCREIADSVEECKKLEKLYWQVEKGATPTSVLLPWFPSPARKQKVAATAEM